MRGGGEAGFIFPIRRARGEDEGHGKDHTAHLRSGGHEEDHRGAAQFPFAVCSSVLFQRESNASMSLFSAGFAALNGWSLMASTIGS